MSTPRLILCPPTAAALDRLNDARELDVKKRTEAKRHGHTEKYMEFETQFQTAAVAFVEHLLEGAVYVDDTDGPHKDDIESTVTKVTVTTSADILPAQEASEE